MSNERVADHHSQPQPVPMRLPCPKCHELHIDAGEFATKPHHTHACQACGAVWRPAIVATVGVRYLPGFRDEFKEVDWGPGGALPHGIRVPCAECRESTDAPGTLGYTFRDGTWHCRSHSSPGLTWLRVHEMLYWAKRDMRGEYLRGDMVSREIPARELWKQIHHEPGFDAAVPPTSDELLNIIGYMTREIEDLKISFAETEE